MHNITTTFTVRITMSLTICTSLLMPDVSLPVSGAAQGQSGAHPVRRGPNRPEGQFPDLDEIKNESNLEREPPAPIPSTIRAKRNEGKPWDGRRVGEPFTPGQLDQAAANRTDRRNRQSQVQRKLLRTAHARSALLDREHYRLWWWRYTRCRPYHSGLAHSSSGSLT